MTSRIAQLRQANGASRTAVRSTTYFVLACQIQDQSSKQGATTQIYTDNRYVTRSSRGMLLPLKATAWHKVADTCVGSQPNPAIATTKTTRPAMAMTTAKIES